MNTRLRENLLFHVKSITTLFHRTSDSTSAIFGDPYYRPRIFDIQSPQPTPDWGISYIPSQPPSLPPPVLVNNWFSSVSTHSSPPPPPPLQGSLSHQFPACTLQRTNPPASSLRAIIHQSIIKQQRLPESGHSPDHDWSKRRVVTSSSFPELIITTQLRISHGVTTNSL